MNIMLIIEIIIITLIAAFQFWIFFQNRETIFRLPQIFPDTNLLSTTSTISSVGGVGRRYRLLDEHTSFSQVFGEIVAHTNALILKFQGKVDMQQLNEMAEKQVQLQIRQAESNTTLPLYMGLLGTFTGVILGLIRISVVGVSDAAIQSFIGGVLIGMIASATGLALTVRSHAYLRENKHKTQAQLVEYLRFLQIYVLPDPAPNMQQEFEEMRQNLQGFQAQFQDHQYRMNETLVDSMQVYKKIQAAYGQVYSVEEQLQGLGRYLTSNQQLVDQLFQSLEGYGERVDRLSNKLTEKLAEMDRKLSQNRPASPSTKVSYPVVAERQYEAQLVPAHNGNGYRSNGQAQTNGYHHLPLVETYEPIASQVGSMGTAWEGFQQEMSRHNRKTQDLLQQLVNKSPQPLGASKALTLFLYTGIAAFAIAIVGRLIQLF